MIEDQGLATVIGEAVAGGAIVMFAMSWLKDIGKIWNAQIKRIVALVLAGGITALTFGGNSDLGWNTFESLDGWKIYIGAWGIAYTSMQANYAGWFKGTRVETGLASSFVNDPHDDNFELGA